MCNINDETVLQIRLTKALCLPAMAINPKRWIEIPAAETEKKTHGITRCLAF